MEKRSKARKGFNPNDVKKYFKGILPPNLDEIRKAGKLFTDPYFLPDDTSILSLKPNGEYIDSVEGEANQREMEEDLTYPKDKRAWARPETIIPGEWKIFDEGINIDDIVQGKLADCYFISAVAALVEYPELIKQNFPEQNYTDIGYYEVVLYIDGEWQRVFLDNFFPIKSNYKKLKKFKEDPYVAFKFTRPNGKELWSMLLEKAWAKVNGGYSNTSGGNQYEVLLALTGYPSEILFNNTDNALEIFKKIENADKKDALMGCASYAGQDSNVNEYNISYGHAYTLIDAKKKGEDLDSIYLYKVRNPWGEGEWQGEWNDKDTKWNDEETKQFFDFTNKEDGVFFMSADDYPQNFHNTQICRILYDAKMRNYLINKEEFFKGALIYNLQLKKDGEVVFSVVERSRRFNRDLPYEKYAYFSLLIFQYDKNFKITKFVGGKSNTVPLGIYEKLEKGFYACVIYFPYEYETLGDDFNYTFTIYSQADFASKFAGKDPKLQCLENLIISYFRNTKDYELGTAGKYICTDIKEIAKATNLIPRIFYNNTNKKMQFTVNYTDKKNVAAVGTYDEKYWNKPIECVLDKGKFGLYLLATYDNPRSYKPSCKLATGESIQSKDAIDFENFRFDNLLSTKFDDDKDLVSPDQKPEKEVVVSTKENAKSIPNIDETKQEAKPEAKPQETKPQEETTKVEAQPEKFTNKMNSVCTFENLKKEYTPEFDVIEKYLKEKQEQSTYPWIKIQSPSGVYAGQMNNNRQIEGRGVFFFNNGQEYIGRFMNGNMEEYGFIFGPKKNLVYKGEIVKGSPNGSGVMYKENKNYYVGDFVNGMLQGYGIAVDSKGNEWVGNYTDNKENGVGLLKTANPKNYYLYEFEKGKAKGQFKLNDEEATVIKMKRDKAANLQEQYSLGQIPKKEVDDFELKVLQGIKLAYDYKIKYGADKTPSFCMLQKRKDLDQKKEELYENSRAEVLEDTDKNLESDAILDQDAEKDAKKKKQNEEEKNKLSKTCIDLTYNETMKFLAWQIIDMNHFYQEKDIKVDPITDSDHEVYALYAEKLPDSDNCYRAISEGDNFYIGEFTGTDKYSTPNGLIRKYDKSKVIQIEGQMHQPFTFDDGPAEKWFSDGGHFVGDLKNEMADGVGEVTFLNGDKWLGPFKNDKKNGTGKYLKKVGFDQYDTCYSNDVKVSEEKAQGNDKFYKTIKNTIPFLGDKERDTLFSFLNEVPPVLSLDKIRWAVLRGKSNNNYFIGQVNPQNKKHGRGIICNTGSENKNYFIGQFKNGKKDGYGVVLNPEFEIEYEGNFKDDYPNGYGNFFTKTYSYHGDFKNGKFHGFGTRYPHFNEEEPEPEEEKKSKKTKKKTKTEKKKQPTSVITVEGIYKNGKEFKVSKIDHLNYTTQILEYDDDGNLVKFNDAVKNNGPDFKRKVDLSNNILKVNFKALEHLKDIENVEQLVPNLKFMTTYRYEKNGLYIGEIDELGMKVGRGKLINLFDKSFYLGQWCYNVREGFGTLYDKDRNKKYEGRFQFDTPMEVGAYFLENGDVIYGKFDHLGSGNDISILDKDTLKQKDTGNYYALDRWDPKIFSVIPKIDELENK